MSALLALSPVTIRAHAQHAGDIYVGLDDNRLITGVVNPDQTIDTSVRVYQSTFGDSGFPGFTANPGYDAAHIFNPSYRIGFDLLSPLQYWNGSGDVHFAATAGESLTLSFLTLSAVTGACAVPGFDLAVQADGGWHRHLSMTLNPPSGSPTPTPGIYLLKLHLYYTAPGSIDSRPFWIAFRHETSQASQLKALQWVNANLANPSCPADTNRSGVVDVDDLIAVILAWGVNCNSPADVNDDGVVNVDDLIAVILGWGKCV